jgi:hypothetical protein
MASAGNQFSNPGGTAPNQAGPSADLPLQPAWGNPARSVSLAAQPTARVPSRPQGGQTAVTRLREQVNYGDSNRWHLRQRSKGKAAHSPDEYAYKPVGLEDIDEAVAYVHHPTAKLFEFREKESLWKHAADLTENKWPQLCALGVAAKGDDPKSPESQRKAIEGLHRLTRGKQPVDVQIRRHGSIPKPGPAGYSYQVTYEILSEGSSDAFFINFIALPGYKGCKGFPYNCYLERDDIGWDWKKLMANRLRRVGLRPRWVRLEASGEMPRCSPHAQTGRTKFGQKASLVAQHRGTSKTKIKE